MQCYTGVFPNIFHKFFQQIFFQQIFFSFSDIVLEEDGGIPASSFLDACEGILPFLDTIGSKTFAPVKMDFLGNISVEQLLKIFYQFFFTINQITEIKNQTRIKFRRFFHFTINFKS